jgi:nucleoside-diphosphate-sugar epimerase
MRRALITGAQGFAGKALIERFLKLGIEVHALMQPEADATQLTRLGVIAHQADGRSGSVDEAVRASKPDITYHLAQLPSSLATTDTFDDTLLAQPAQGLYLLDSLLRRKFPNFVFVGGSSRFEPGTDAALLARQAAAHEAFEKHLALHAEMGLNTTSLTLLDAYGPGDRADRLIPMLVRAVESGDGAALPRADEMMDLVYRSDLAEALYLAGAGLIGRPQDWRNQNFALTGQCCSVGMLVETLERVAGRALQKRWGEWKLPPGRSQAPGGKPPGWNAHVMLEEGLRLTLIAGPHAP